MSINDKNYPKSERPVPDNYKQINRDSETGRLELIDYTGNIIECNIYGSPKKQFFKDATGIISFKERLKKGLIKEVKNNNKSLYIPKTLRFEGSSMFPRPVSLPFVNQIPNPNKLMRQIKKEGRLTENNNANIFSLKKPPKGNLPSFMCHKIGKNNPTERKYLIKLIDKYISDKKKKYKFKVDTIIKSSEVKALNKYKQKLRENMSNSLCNGKKVPSSNQKDILFKYDSIRKAIIKNGLNNSSLKDYNSGKIINFEEYKNLYKIKGVGNENNIFKHPEKIKEYNTFISDKKRQVEIGLNINNDSLEDKNISYIDENIKHKTYYLNPNMNIYSMLKKGNKFKLFKEQSNKNKKENYKSNDEKFKHTVTTEFDRNNDESFRNAFNNGREPPNNKNLYIPTNLYRNYGCMGGASYSLDKFTKTSNTFYKNVNENDIVIEDNGMQNSNKRKYDQDNYSFISDEKNEGYNYDKKFMTGSNFRTVYDIKNYTSKEKTLLKGYVNKTANDGKKKFKVYKNKREDSTLKHYINELELIKKVNKIAVEKAKRINDFRDSVLKKKLAGKKILELNYKK